MSRAAPVLSDSFALSSSSVMLPGGGRDGSKSKNKKRTYWQSVASIGAQVADALEYAHRQGIHHRDIKPSNLLLDTRGTVWVTDFGLAKADDQQNLTHTGDILGTLRYMPPEAFEGKTDARSDVYSLGLTLYELLAFRPAYDEHERNRLIRQVTSEEPAAAGPGEPAGPAGPGDDRQQGDRARPGGVATPPPASWRPTSSGSWTTSRFWRGGSLRRERFLRWARRNPGIAFLGAAFLTVLVAVTIASLMAAGYFNDLRGREATAAAGERGGAATGGGGRGPASGPRGNWRKRPRTGERTARRTGGRGRGRGPPPGRRRTLGALSVQYRRGRRGLAATKYQHRPPRPRCRARPSIATGNGSTSRASSTVPGSSSRYQVGQLPDLRFAPSGRRSPWSRARTARFTCTTWPRARAGCLRRPFVSGVCIGVPSRRQADSRRWDAIGRIHLWDLSNGRESAVLSGDGRPLYSPDGSRIASPGGSRASCGTPAPARKSPSSPSGKPNEGGMVFSPDGKQVAVTSKDGTPPVRRRHGPAARHPRPASERAGRSPGFQRGWQADRRLDDGRPTVYLWDTATGKEVAALRGHTAYVSRYSFQPGRVAARHRERLPG